MLDFKILLNIYQNVKYTLSLHCVCLYSDVMYELRLILFQSSPIQKYIQYPSTVNFRSNIKIVPQCHLKRHGTSPNKPIVVPNNNNPFEISPSETHTVHLGGKITHWDMKTRKIACRQ